MNLKRHSAKDEIPERFKILDSYKYNKLCTKIYEPEYIPTELELKTTYYYKYQNFHIGRINNNNCLIYKENNTI